MDYRRFINSSNKSLKINDHLIEYGGTTWQIRNIAATSVKRTVVPFNEPEPLFNWPEPKIDLNVKKMFGFSFLTWVLVSIFSNSGGVGAFFALLTFGGFIAVAVMELDKNKTQWSEEKQQVQHQWQVWNQMRNNPPVLFSLMLETNAGSKPLFYSLNEDQIVKSNEAVKRSMTKKDGAEINLEIETLNMGGDDSINNFGSSIYQQSIQGA